MSEVEPASIERFHYERGYGQAILDNRAAIDRLEAAEREVGVLREALAWYGEQAEAVAKYLTGRKRKIDADNLQPIMAILTVLSLDAGRRARPHPAD